MKNHPKRFPDTRHQSMVTTQSYSQIATDVDLPAAVVENRVSGFTHKTEMDEVAV